MRVYLVQHGTTRSKEEDPERRLAEEGVAEVERIAAFLRPLDLKVDAIWHSGKPRAAQTAEILSKGFSGRAKRMERDSLAPKDSVWPIKQILEESSSTVVVVGHMPFLGKLASLLVTAREDIEMIGFRYGCVVCLERDESGSWKVIWMIPPDLVKG